MGGTEIYVIAPIDATHRGPTANGPRGRRQPIHLRQGSVDGACGPYCLFMSLLVSGEVAATDLTGLAGVDRRTRLGKLLGLCNEYGAFFREGTDTSDLGDLLRRTYSRRLNVQTIGADANSLQVRDFVREQVEQNRPVILELRFPGGGHWVLVVGLEYLRTPKGKVLCRFLVLDPSDPEPRVSAWNGVVDAREIGGRYPFTWWTGDGRRVRLAGAVAVWAGR